MYQNNENIPIHKNIDIPSLLRKFSNNFDEYNKIFSQNLTNLISFYENLCFYLETIPSRIILYKIDSSPLFKNHPIINTINTFYTFHYNILNNFPKISTNIKKDLIPKLKSEYSHIQNCKSTVTKFISEAAKKIETAKASYADVSQKYKIEQDKFQKLEIDSIQKCNDKSMINLIYKNLEEQKNVVSKLFLSEQTEKIKLNDLYNSQKKEVDKMLNDIKLTYEDYNSIIYDNFKSYIDIWNNNVIEACCNGNKKINEKIQFNVQNQNTQIIIDSILENEFNKKIFQDKWNIEKFNEQENFKETSNKYYNYKFSKIPNTDIKYDQESMLVIKMKNFDTNFFNDLSFFLNLLVKNEDIPSTQLSKYMLLFDDNTGNIEFYQNFCDGYLLNHRNDINIIYEFHNFINLTHFKTFFFYIFENISANLIKKDFNSFLLLDKIIIIGEITLYNDKCLCSYFSKNKIFTIKNIWDDCIKFKIIELISEVVNQNSIQEGWGKLLYNSSSKLLGNFLRKDSNKKQSKDYLSTILDINNYN